MQSEIRKDYFQDTYVVIAPERVKRPRPIQQTKTVLQKNCVFCPDHVRKHEKIIDRVGPRKQWDIAAITNLYPALSPKNPKAYGVQEIIIETRYPAKQLEDCSLIHIEKLLAFYAKRVRAIKKNKRIAYVTVFKNYGEAAGATKPHAHSQIFGLDFVPPLLAQEARAALAYRLRHGICPHCAILEKEMKSTRFVAEKNGIVAFTPYASTYQYELWILPQRHVDNITELTPRELIGCAILLKRATTALAKLNLPYNYTMHEVVADEGQHFVIKITPRGGVMAGLEIGAGVTINSVAPEIAALYYRKQFRNLS